MMRARRLHFNPDDEIDDKLYQQVWQAAGLGERDFPLSTAWTFTDPDGVFDLLDLPKVDRRLMQAAMYVIASAIVAGPARWVSYSRDWNFYAARRGDRAFTYLHITGAVELVGRASLIREQRARPGANNWVRSRFQALPVLCVALEKISPIPRYNEPIRLRDTKGFPVHYRESRRIVRLRRDVISIREGLAAIQISLNSQLIREGDPLPNGGRFQMTPYRVFNQNFARGGRYFGMSHQNLPASTRQSILINGEPVVEEDYESHHLWLIYRMSGLEMPAAPYSIGRWERREVKIACLIGLNAATEAKWCLAIVKTLGFEHWGAKALIEDIKTKHPSIAHLFGTDAGARLMNTDSAICGEVMRRMMQLTGLPSLSVHDSHIVQARHQGVLQGEMERAPYTLKIPGFEARNFICSSVNQHPDSIDKSRNPSDKKGGWILEDGGGGDGVRELGGGGGAGVSGPGVRWWWWGIGQIA